MKTMDERRWDDLCHCGHVDTKEGMGPVNLGAIDSSTILSQGVKQQEIQTYKTFEYEDH